MMQVDTALAFRERMKAFPVIKLCLTRTLRFEVKKRDFLKELRGEEPHAFVAWQNRGDIIYVYKVGDRASCEAAF